MHTYFKFVVLLIFLATTVSTTFADTFESSSSNRVEACKGAKDRGRMVMERNYTSMKNQALGGTNRLRVGECDCSENSAAISGSRWACIVEVEIAGVDIPTPPPSNRSPKKEGNQVRSDSATGPSQTEACSDAKDAASRAVKNANAAVRSYSSCKCESTSSNISLYRYQCSVDTTYSE